mmetsp:Transcript_51662/g.126799  ORF Transcript_51662/g.126799 Transcript_51662/m.126799 type:complete len:252 (-) Transcript_51662:457-1212(-)
MVTSRRSDLCGTSALQSAHSSRRSAPKRDMRCRVWRLSMHANVWYGTAVSGNELSQKRRPTALVILSATSWRHHSNSTSVMASHTSLIDGRAVGSAAQHAATRSPSSAGHAASSAGRWPARMNLRYDAGSSCGGGGYHSAPLHISHARMAKPYTSIFSSNSTRRTAPRECAMSSGARYSRLPRISSLTVGALRIIERPKSPTLALSCASTSMLSSLRSRCMIFTESECSHARPLATPLTSLRRRLRSYSVS